MDGHVGIPFSPETAATLVDWSIRITEFAKQQQDPLVQKEAHLFARLIATLGTEMLVWQGGVINRVELLVKEMRRGTTEDVHGGDGAEEAPRAD